MGLTCCFSYTFGRCWKPNILLIFEAFFRGKLDMSRLNIALIPKKNEACELNEFCHISLLNGVDKLITEVFANHLKSRDHFLIEPTQSTFLANRSSFDRSALAQEILSCFRKNCTAFFLKLGDTLNWDFLLSTLLARGFSSQWCGWIQDCLFSGIDSVLVNDISRGHIKCRRAYGKETLSLLISLSLFWMCLEKFLTLLVMEDLFKWVPSSLIFKPTCLQYADDTLILAPMDPNSLSST